MANKTHEPTEPQQFAGEQQITCASVTPSPFFKLPLELRLGIYEEVLLITNAADDTGEKININSVVAKPPALTQVCKAIRAESTPVFLKNGFKIVIKDFDTTSVDTWFAFFEEFDTSEVHLQIQWCIVDSHLGWPERCLPLFEVAYANCSKLIPETPLRQWVIRDRLHKPLLPSLREVDLQINRSSDKDTLSFMTALAEKTRALAAKGEDWGTGRAKILASAERLQSTSTHFLVHRIKSTPRNQLQAEMDEFLRDLSARKRTQVLN